MNLVVNARDAMPLGGRLEVATSYVAPRIDGAGEVVRIRVSDTGTGIEAETRADLRTVLHHEGAGQGTGLGLSTVLGIVRQAGGIIAVEHARARLGVLGGPAAAGAPAPRRRTTPSRAVRAATRPCCSSRTTRSCATTCSPASSSRAIASRAPRAARRHSSISPPRLPALVLTDVTMPGISGIELARRVRLAPAVPVLFMTGYTRSFEPDGETHEFAGRRSPNPSRAGTCCSGSGPPWTPAGTEKSPGFALSGGQIPADNARSCRHSGAGRGETE